MTRYTFSHVGHLKYQVVELFNYQLPDFVVQPGDGRNIIKPKIAFFKSEFLILKDKQLTIRPGFAYDGATNVIDTRATKAAALIHDALYFVLRNSDQFHPKRTKNIGKVGGYECKSGDFTKHNWLRAYADVLYYRIARANGMWWPRARLHYKALRKYGKLSAKPRGRRRIRDVNFKG